MKKADLDLYTDYLLSTCGFATATGLSAMVDAAVSHDKVSRFLSAQQYTCKDLWAQAKKTVRSMQSEEGGSFLTTQSKRRPGPMRAS